ncbi:hypothetical protein JCM8547_007482 [Rhodosporidiobolus lusitaniae]
MPLSASPKTPTDAVKTEEPCCVCDTITTQRCGACSEVELDLFFCAREHQKVVWFADKCVCGEISKPFTFPPFSREEAQEIKVYLQSSSDAGDQDKRPVLIIDMASLLGHCKPEDIISLIDGFTEGAEADKLLSSAFFPNGTLLPLIILEPLIATAIFTCRLELEIDRALGISEKLLSNNLPWYDRLLHQAVVVAALRYHHYKHALQADTPSSKLEDKCRLAQIAASRFKGLTHEMESLQVGISGAPAKAISSFLENLGWEGGENGSYAWSNFLRRG